MKKKYEIKYHILEENYWWFVGRRDFILKLLEYQNRNSQLLDIGCAGGSLIKALGKRGFSNISGIDISEKAIKLCKKRGAMSVAVMEGTKLAFSDGAFDIVVASDILEHMENDLRALKEWKRVLKPSGKLIAFVPAFNALWSSHDDINLHYRRYSLSELRRLLKSAGFEIERGSYWNFIVFFPFFLLTIWRKLYNKKKPDDNLYNFNAKVNASLLRLLKFENWLLRFFNFPVGISAFVIAKKK